MKPDNLNSQQNKHKLVLLVLLLALAAGLFGWYFGRYGSRSGLTNNTTQQAAENNANSAEVSSLVSYVLPDGWAESSCAGNGAVFVTPNQTAADCASNPVAPVKISVDAGNNKDCNQLQNVSDVKKHVCISLYINGHKTLKASTEYLASSAYKKATTINAYYFDTAKGVVKLEYIYTTDNQFQAGFDQLANSLNVKK